MNDTPLTTTTTTADLLGDTPSSDPTVVDARRVIAGARVVARVFRLSPGLMVRSDVWVSDDALLLSPGGAPGNERIDISISRGAIGAAIFMATIRVDPALLGIEAEGPPAAFNSVAEFVNSIVDAAPGSPMGGVSILADDGSNHTAYLRRDGVGAGWASGPSTGPFSLASDGLGSWWRAVRSVASPVDAANGAAHNRAPSN